MFDTKLIAALAALIFITGATMAIGKQVESAIPANKFSDNPIFDAKKQVSIVLAQNDKRTPEASGKTEAESETRESEAAAGAERKSSEAEPKPLKPFVPSEKIPGDQAVDFPVDI